VRRAPNFPLFCSNLIRRASPIQLQGRVRPPPIVYIRRCLTSFFYTPGHERETCLQENARDGVQLLIASLFSLPTVSPPEGPLGQLPTPTTQLPRAKCPHPYLPKHKLCYPLINSMAQTFLRSVHDVVNCGYEYIIVGT
jgi:hypothetical protein